MRAARLVLLGILALAFAAVALTTVARADPPGMDGGGDVQVVLLADIRSDFNVMEAGSTLPMRVIVVDQHGVPVPGALVELSGAGVTISPAAGATDADGVFRFHLTAGATLVTSKTTITATVTMPGAMTGSDRFDLTIAKSAP